jgi:pimeloyl-ACP methyl ester carboxylesterase
MMKDNARTVAELDTRLPVFTSEDARRIMASTLLINGANSPKFFHTIVDDLAKAIPKSEVIRISGSAHFPHVENPSEFNTQLLEFLQKQN